ncbi:LysR family transcriptional regulator [Roseomonas sp. 18066]|uniref:LysR family transcriptional regulator n=1 Tax=Roseomonas sp. 18066 TaxID=2681412 RepID=UPI0013584CE1|nr:LysR family transcriptional regulator [Roseomonas sp. 18066]
MDEAAWKIIAELRRTPNVTRAADRLFMSQPNLSKKLQGIEAALGVRLVLRTSKGISFTPEGEYLADEAEQMLARLAEIRGNLLRLGSGASGTVRLGMTNGFARHLLPPCLRRFQQAYPGAALDIATDISASVVRRLERDEIHVGFIRGELEGGFERALIGSEQACLVHAAPIALAALPATPQIAYLSDPFARRLVERWWHSHFRARPLVGMRANHGDTCLEMIANGLGYGIFLAPNFLGPGRPLWSAPLHFADGRPVLREAWMIWRREFAEIPLIRNFLAHMQGEIAAGLL